jgi:hypothetical protein
MARTLDQSPPPKSPGGPALSDRYVMSNDSDAEEAYDPALGDR